VSTRWRDLEVYRRDLRELQARVRPRERLATEGQMETGLTSPAASSGIGRAFPLSGHAHAAAGVGARRNYLARGSSRLSTVSRHSSPAGRGRHGAHKEAVERAWRGNGVLRPRRRVQYVLDEDGVCATIPTSPGCGGARGLGAKAARCRRTGTVGARRRRRAADRAPPVGAIGHPDGRVLHRVGEPARAHAEAAHGPRVARINATPLGLGRARSVTIDPKDLRGVRVALDLCTRGWDAWWRALQDRGTASR